MTAKKGSAVFVWGKWLPYHFARVRACAECFAEAGLKVVGVQYSDVSRDYRIKSGLEGDDFVFLSPRLGRHETDFRPWRILSRWPRLLVQHRAKVVFVPSYWDWSVTIAVVSKVFGCRVVMMNESHAGTEQATGWKRWIKRQIVKRFDAAFVGGEPHKRHFASLGIPSDKIFTGYDAVDNALFAARADEVRSMEHGARSVEQDQKADEIRAEAKKSVQFSVFSVQQEEKADEVRTLSSQRSQSRGSKEQDRPEAEHLSTLNSQPSTKQSVRSAYGLPERYFLSLGRMVEKKNLATLIAAYGRYCDEWRVTSDESARRAPVSLVFVGSGELEGALKEQARSLGLRVVDRTDAGPKTKRLKDEETKGPQSQAEPRLSETGLSQNCKPNTENSVESDRGAVYFYGFRQIEENPVFYALAEAFVLPSLKEEWGLVVNEAMACSVPVIVSRTAGCAEDLLPGSESWQRSVGSVQFGEEKTTDDRKPLTDDSLEERSNGFVFDPKSSDALSEALRRIADPLNPQRSTLNAAAMGRRSREIVERFSCENFARQAMRSAEATGAS